MEGEERQAVCAKFGKWTLNLARTACLSSPSTLQDQDPGLPCPMEPLCKTTCHCRGPCGYMTSNNKDGVQIVLFFFMNVACLLCSLSLFIDYSDQKEQITMTTARSGLPHNVFHSLVYILTIVYELMSP